ncbi:MAG: OmpA family protein [Bacteroidia bacterium]|nr:OmpA family protein [Bacteroidia bacterium]
MRRCVLGCLGLLASLAQGQTPLWQQVYGGSAYEELRGSLTLPGGTYLHAGSTRSTDGVLTGRESLDFDAWLVKTDARGRLLWQQCFGGTGNDKFLALQALPDGGFVAVGYTESLELTHGEADVYVVCTDALGTLRWARAFGGSGNDRGYGVALQPDGTLLIAAEAGSNDGDVASHAGGVDIWVLALSPAGEVRWQRTYGGKGTDRAVAIAATDDGGCVVLASSDSDAPLLGPSRGRTDVVFLRLDSRGALRYATRTGGSDVDEPHGLARGLLDTYYAVGTTFSRDGAVQQPKGEGDVWVVAFRGPTGEVAWARTYGGESHDGANGITALPTGELLVAAISRSQKGQRTTWRGLFDGWLLKLRPQGELVWQTSLGGFQNDEFYGVTLTPQGDYLVAGTTRSTDKDLYLLPTQGGNDAWLVALRDPQNPSRALPEPQTFIAGYVTHAQTGAPLSAEVVLVDDQNKPIARTQTNPTTGLFQFATARVVGLSLGAVAEGFLFYSSPLTLIADEVGTEVRLQVALQPLAPDKSLILNNLTFDPGSGRLRPASYAELDRLVRFLELNPTARIRIDGHSGGGGTENQRYQLSFQRAQEVRAYLLTRGIAPSRSEVRAWGSQRPLVPEVDDQSRELNRRVEITVLPDSR